MENSLTKGAYFDMAGRRLLSLFVGTYSDGHFHNGRYRLEQAAEHLLARPDVEVIARPRHTYFSDTVALAPAEALHPIPHYNAGASSTESLVFLWRPTGATRTRIVDWFHADRKHNMMHFWTFVFQEDLLGLRACGAALFQSPHTDLDD